MGHPFDPTFELLPREIPIFPLTGVLLLPHGRLPLNIFEPRYLNMTRAALAAPCRLIGMIQPSSGTDVGQPEVFTVGCAGRITQFGETDDGRYLITLRGICRFTIVDELALLDGYRRVVPDFAKYRRDMADEGDADVDRERMIAALKRYLGQQGVEANWEALNTMKSARLVTTLAMTCPFAPTEKQALLEADTLETRAKMLLALLDMAAAGSDDGGGAKVRH
jgi:Lon protease-like protein